MYIFSNKRETRNNRVTIDTRIECHWFMIFGCDWKEEQKKTHTNWNQYLVNNDLSAAITNYAVQIDRCAKFSGGDFIFFCRLIYFRCIPQETFIFVPFFSVFGVFFSSPYRRFTSSCAFSSMPSLSFSSTSSYFFFYCYKWTGGVRVLDECSGYSEWDSFNALCIQSSN